MAPPKRNSHFKQEWLLDNRYKDWITRHETSIIHAFCKVCASDIHLGSIRIGALESHRKGKKHTERQARSVGSSLHGWLKHTSGTATSPDISVSGSTTSVSEQVEVTATSSNEIKQVSDTQSKVVHVSSNSSAGTSTHSFLTSDCCQKAEILWALHSTVTHSSFHSNQVVGTIFQEMFPDSEIAKQFTCGRTKLAYLVTFGLAPYFKDELHDALQKSSHIVVLFDESFNRVTKDEQMDNQVRFWNNEQECVMTRYLSSEFLGHCTAKDLLQRLKEGIWCIDSSRIIQLSMDGPNVNLKLFRDFIADRKINNPDAPDVLDIGSCGLHVVHGAFKTGVTATGWKLDQLLRSLWYLFDGSPARRADYT